MSGRHRSRRNRLPFALLLLLLLLAVVAAVWVGPSRRDGERVLASRPSPISSSEPSPDSSPDPSPAKEPREDKEEPQRGRLIIHGTGDVNVDPSYIPNLRTYGWDYAWSGLDGLFRRDDLTVINLECAVSELGIAVPKEFNFRGDPAALPAMRKAGVDAANLGNNHAYDYGPSALVDTIRNLRSNDIAPVGAGRDRASALAPAVFRLDGWKVAVVGLDMVVDPYPSAIATASKPGTAAGHDTGLMLRAIRDANRAADIVIVTIHWGVELDTQPRSYQVALGHRFVQAGADAVFGHHAHRLQPMSVYKGRPIFWGLGNFVWPSLSAEGSTTAVARVIVDRGGDVHGRLLPAYIESSGHPVLR